MVRKRTFNAVEEVTLRRYDDTKIGVTLNVTGAGRVGTERSAPVSNDASWRNMLRCR